MGVETAVDDAAPTDARAAVTIRRGKLKNQFVCVTLRAEHDQFEWVPASNILASSCADRLSANGICDGMRMTYRRAFASHGCSSPPAVPIDMQELAEVTILVLPFASGVFRYRCFGLSACLEEARRLQAPRLRLFQPKCLQPGVNSGENALAFASGHARVMHERIDHADQLGVKILEPQLGGLLELAYDSRRKRMPSVDAER